MIWLGAAENVPNARETLCPGCPSLASPFLEIKIPNQSTCTTVPGQFKKKTFPTQNLKIEKAHLEKGDLNISFCGRQDVDITHNRQSLFFLTQGIHAALTHKPGSRHAVSLCFFSVQLPAEKLGFRRGFTAMSYKAQWESWGWGQVVTFKLVLERAFAIG